jgi:hypothetical protein
LDSETQVKLDLADMVLEELARETAFLIDSIRESPSDMIVTELSDGVRRKIDYGLDDEEAAVDYGYLQNNY